MSGHDSAGIDKDALYGKYEEGQKWQRDRYDRREKLSTDIARKAADLGPEIPEEDMNIDVRKGVQGAELAEIISSLKQDKQQPQATPPSTRGRDLMLGAALAAVLGTGAVGTAGAGLLGGWLLLGRDKTEVSVPDAEYDVRFYDSEGNLIDVNPITEKPDANQDGKT